jgi:site-specific recombinase XerC
VGANSKAGKSPKSAVPPAVLPLLRGYLDHLSNERRLSGHTLSNYERDIAALMDVAGDTPLKAMQVNHVRRYVAQLHSRGLGGKSLARMLSAWRGSSTIFPATTGSRRIRSSASARRSRANACLTRCRRTRRAA